jgi:DNA-binding winged helix-turn-helix (wHTH) protein
MAHDLQFQVLGPLVVSRGGVAVELPRSPLLRGLLAVLLLAGSESLPADRLAAAVWHDRHGEVSRAAVQVAISRLRTWLQRTAGAGGSIAHAGEGYRLGVPSAAVDLGRLRALVEAAAKTDDADRRFELLGSAMVLRRGPVLADLTTVDAADPLVEAANQDVRAAALAFGAAALAIGRPDEALAHLQADRRTGPRLRDRPARRGRATRGSPSALRGVLPLAPAGFIGRSYELAELDALLAGEEHDTAVVISAVSGTAGVGKTALAVHWAHLARDRFPDGQLYINLRGYDPDQPVHPADALAQFLTSLGIRGPDVPLDLDERAARYRTATAGRRMLIVLDNASSVEQVRPLLPGNPSCAVVVTSRDSLAGLVAINGARRVDLDLLPTADAIALLRRLIARRRAHRVLLVGPASGRRRCAHVRAPWLAPRAGRRRVRRRCPHRQHS